MSTRKQFLTIFLKLIIGIFAGLAIAAHVLSKESLCYELFMVSGLTVGVLRLLHFTDDR